AAGDDHVRALLRQQAGDGFADTPAGAGDQRNTAGQVKQFCTHAFLLSGAVCQAPWVTICMAAMASGSTTLPAHAACLLDALPSCARLATPWAMAARRKKLNAR